MWAVAILGLALLALGCDAWTVLAPLSLSRKTWMPSVAARYPRMLEQHCECDAEASPSALSALIEKATFTAHESWRRQEITEAGNQGARSASGGTSWADGSWLDPDLEKELVTMLNRSGLTDHFKYKLILGNIWIEKGLACQ